ncbi:MAG TPA: (deoxy)nucleoside triphosphate pyrophosphohydrolase [Syntrophorhabdaceae bacterium]|nr:(deoxy)nucleoside triphosphate pyrophosphohydrolase [Syntrophorhabdaceae bacterium]
MIKKQSPQIVSAGVIEKDGLVLIGKRKRGKRFAGNWEFPGGTLEKGETPEQCLKRELLEELSIEVEVGELFCSSIFAYTPEWTVKLLAYRVTLISGVFNLSDHDEIRWVKPAELINYNFPEADKPIVEKLFKNSLKV